jgi:hypothetical protein
MEHTAAPREVTLKPKSPPAALLQAGAVAKQVVPLSARQVTLFEDKITIRDTTGDAEALPRRYTLSHTDRTADLFLSVGTEYDREAVEQNQTGQMPAGLLAELTGGDAPRLTVRCRDEGAGGQRLEKELPLALAVIRYGDRFFYERHPELDQAEVIVQSEATGPSAQEDREFGRVTDYRVTRIAGESRRLVVGAAALAAVGIGALVIGKLRNR